MIENAMWLYGVLLKLQQADMVVYISADDIFKSKRRGEDHIEFDLCFRGSDKIYQLFAYENGFKFDFQDNNVVSKEKVIIFLGRKMRRVV